MNQDSLRSGQVNQSQFQQLSTIQHQPSLRSRLYKNLASEPQRTRYEIFEKVTQSTKINLQRLMQASSQTNKNSVLVPKVTLRSRLEPIQTEKQSSIGVIINQGKIIVDRSKLGLQYNQSHGNLSELIEIKPGKLKSLAPLTIKNQSILGDESIIKGNNNANLTIMDESIIGIFSEAQVGPYNLKKQIKERRDVKQHRKKGDIARSSLTLQQRQLVETSSKDYLTPMDFIHLIRTDPEMVDEFCYLNKCGDPYDFKIVEFEERDPKEYMTISARGITHFLYEEAIFLTIEEWEREARLYQRIRSIEFFQKYKLWKNFFLWKRLMRRNMFFKNQNTMSQQLFSVDRQLRMTLLEVRRICQNMQSEVRFLDSSQKESLSHDDFKNTQEKYRNTFLAQKFDSFEQLVKDLLVSCCQKSLYTFKEENRIPLNDDAEQEVQERAPLLVGDESGKEMPYTQEATVRTHFKRLRKFVKLIDFLIVDSKLQLITQQTETLVVQIRDMNSTYVDTKKETKKYSLKNSGSWITVEAILRNENMQFLPTREGLRKTFEEIITKCVTRICTKHKEMSHAAELQQFVYNENDYTSHGQTEPTDLKTLINATEQFLVAQVSLKQQVDQSFIYLEEYADKFKQFLIWYLENSQIDIQTTFQTKEVDEFKQAVQIYKEQDTQFQAMEPTAEISIILFDFNKLKEKIKNSAAHCSQELYKFMPELNYQKASQLVSKAQQLHGIISVLPSSVEQFVQYMENVQIVSQNLDGLANLSQEITAMSLLLDELKIKVPERYKAKFQDVGYQMTTLRKKVDDAMANYDQNLNRFRKDMEKMVPLVDARVKELQEKINEQPIGDLKADMNKLVKLILDLRMDLNQLKEHAKKLNTFQLALQMEYTNFDRLDEFENEFTLIEKLWLGRKDWLEYSTLWQKKHFLHVDIEQISTIIERLQKAANHCAKELERNEVAVQFKADIEGFRGVISVLTSLRDPSLKEKDWIEIRTLVGKDVFSDLNDPTYTIQWIYNTKLFDIKDKLSEIALKAAKEVELVRMIENVEAVWRSSTIVVSHYKDNKEVSILGNNEDLIAKIDDTLLTVNNILGSRFVEGIRQRVELQLKLLRYFQELFDEWMLHQRNWLYLEPILNSPYSAKNLVKETKVFQQADTQWKKLMRQVRDNPVAKKWADDFQSRTVLSMLRGNNNNFEIIQKALDDFLEKKREVFQRFFFLSNDELLEILSQAKSLQLVQPFLRKCFENIVRLQFDKQDNPIGMISAEGEIVPLRNYQARGSEVEEWLKYLEEQMKYSLRVIMRQALIKYENENTQRKDWILEYPLQVVVSLDSVFWTKITEENYLSGDAEGDLDDWYEANVSLLDELTILIRGDLTDLQRRTLVALVTQDVHFRDIIDNMRNESIEGIMDFKWQQQLRFYYEDEYIHAKQVNAKLVYGYEYLGSTTRLVITPLTDRCWMTITGALGIKLGAAPQGPAGTGKTESCKDLAKALGRFCIVFNCSDQITAKMMEKLFAGLAYCGAWVCLDEFNRIYIEVLSVIAQQVQTIRDALLENRQTFMFFGKNVLLNNSLGVFITMNPGYAGRTELPDNLKVLFRPVAMMVPDYRLIAEIMLFAEGFSNARDLSRKMTKLYKLSSEQLSQQDHYDFGMRAVKSLLVMAGSLKRADPQLSEDVVLVRAMREANIPKFLAHDIPLFNAIVQDLFPGLQIPTSENRELLDMIELQIKTQGLEKVPTFIQKIVQFHETLRVRFGVMLVGATFGGKSQCLNILRLTYIALNNLEGNANHPVYQNVEQQVLNPKAISMDELYGQFDIMTQQWTDGLASNIMRGYSSQETPDKKWVIFDGPVDALWIENMNTVLDDSMTLCLSNGERVKLKPEMRMLFEVLDLAVASPATVSRCGMVYLDDQVVGYAPIVSKECGCQLSTIFSKELIQSLEQQIQLAFNKAIPILQRKTKQIIYVSETQLAVSIIRIIKMTVLRYSEEYKLDCTQELNKKHLEKLFIWAFCWAVGSTISSETIDVFERTVTECFSVDLLPRGSVMDYLTQITKANDGVVSVDYVPFEELVPEFQYKKGMSFFDMIIPTKETVSYGWFLEQCILYGEFPLLVTGVTGTGKTTMVTQKLNELLGAGSVSLLTVSFSAKTSSFVTQASIEQKLQTNRKNKRTILMPPPGKRMVVFVDDVNMPATEVYGAQPPIELLRQLIDYNGVYDRKGFFWKDIESTTLVCACGPSGGGRSPLTPRFTRHFTLMALPNSSEKTLSWIFSTIARNFLRGNNFKNELIELADSGALVNGTLAVFNEIQKVLLPTPDRSHYVFNLRDVSRVFQGICMTKPTVLQKNEQLARLWAHETCRVFMDRLINQQDQDWFKQELVKNLFLFFKLEYKVDEIFESKPPLLFVDFIKRGIELQDRTYDEIKDYNQLVKVISEYMTEETKLNLVLFKDAVQHLSRMARVLRQQRGHYMLVGVGGSGKKSITQLASVLAGCTHDTLESKKNYGKKEFKEDLFRLMCKVGIDNQILAFSFQDTQITQEGFLEDVNNLINSGEVPNMLTKEDIDIINNGLVSEAREKKVTDVYAYFTSKVRSNLHVVLGMSPVGSQLRVRLRMFPSLVNCCTIEWLQQWPEEALLSVASMFLEQLEFDGLTTQIKENLYSICVTVHQSVEAMCSVFFNALRRNVYVTPKSYLDLIESYKDLLKLKKEELISNKVKLSSGLNKLAEANSIITDLKAKLTELQPILKQKTIEQDQLIAKLEVDSVEANKVKVVVQEDERQVNEKAQKIREMKAEADKILNDALPILQGAMEALNTLNRNDISEIKGNNNPHAIVKFTLECVAILLDDKTDWDSIKKALSDANFLSRMKNLNVNSITIKTQQRIQAKIASNPLFIPSEIQKINFAAKSMCEWVRAVSDFTDVNREIEKKKSQVEALDVELKKANTILKVKQDELGSVIKKVNELEALYTANKREKDRLDQEIKTTEDRLIRAEELTVGLADEQLRWKETVSSLGEEIKLLLGNVFLAAGTISYLGPFTGPYRNELINGWLSRMVEMEIPHSEEYSFEKIAGEPVQIQHWAAKGLPNDSVSISNGIIQMYCRSYPLFIDPQTQANKWIKNLYFDAGIKIIKVSPDLLKNVENAIRQGLPLLIEDIGENLESTLEPLLLKQYTIVNRRKMIRLGDSDIEIDPQFRLFFSTKIANPQFLPDVFIRVTVINFTVTEQGLEEQLLGDVVSREMPDVEQTKQELIQIIARGKANLKRNEERILELLASSKGMILDNIDLIENLKLSKMDATQVKQSLAESEEKSIEIEQARAQYLPVAIRGSILYFVISDFALVDPMYQFSLSYFKRLFGLVITNTEKSPTIQQRIQNLLYVITETLYSNVCRGLFNAHKRIFSFIMTAKIQTKAGIISNTEWAQFIRGAPIPKIPHQLPKDTRLTEKQWNEINHLSTIHKNLADIVHNYQRNSKNWEMILFADNPWNIPIPEIDEHLTSFQRLLIVRILREEETLYSMTYYVDAVLGKKFTSSNPATIEEVFQDTDCKTPLIFILSAGADPLAGLTRFATSRKITADKLTIISLGQGQGVVAERAIENSLKLGGWVILQNCHLGKSFMPQLEKRIESFEDPELQGQINQNFRLVLTSMPCDYFPVSVLQNGVKITTEPPKGLKSNMYKSLSEIPDEYFEGCEKNSAFKKLLFSLAFFHGVVQERRKFGPLGWNIRYEFNDSDFETSYTLLRNFLDLPQEIPWDAINYVVGEISYGGRVTDDWDRRCLLTILSKFINEDVLNQGYQFSVSGTYVQQVEGSIEDYKNIIDKFPDFENPEVFGMNENANITFKLTESKQALNTILSIQPRDQNGGITQSQDSQQPKTQDQVIDEMCDILLTKLPMQIKKKEDSGKTKVEQKRIIGKKDEIDSLRVCVSQEIIRFNRLLSAVQASLINLKKAIKGEVVMSTELDNIYQSLLNNQVPHHWTSKAYPSLKPLASFYEDMIQRVQFFQNWFDLEGGMAPKSYWLSAFFFPQGFLTSVLQTFARKNQIPIDILGFSFKFMNVLDPEQILSPPDNGAYIYGLYVEGCRFDFQKMLLEDSLPGVTISQAPIIHFVPTEDYKPEPTLYSMPLYKTNVRAGTLSTTGHSTNFIISIECPTKKSPEYWVLNGAAFVTQQND